MGGKLSGPGGFFADADFDFEARIVLGAAASGLGDVGLVLATMDRIADGDPQSWFDAWTGVGADLASRGEQALGRGHLATASWAFLAAAEYYIKALVFPSQDLSRLDRWRRSSQPQPHPGRHRRGGSRDGGGSSRRRSSRAARRHGRPGLPGHIPQGRRDHLCPAISLRPPAPTAHPAADEPGIAGDPPREADHRLRPEWLHRRP